VTMAVSSTAETNKSLIENSFHFRLDIMSNGEHIRSAHGKQEKLAVTLSRKREDV
jgi:hypothetical protein